MRESSIKIRSAAGCGGQFRLGADEASQAGTDNQVARLLKPHRPEQAQRIEVEDRISHRHQFPAGQVGAAAEGIDELQGRPAGSSNAIALTVKSRSSRSLKMLPPRRR